MAVTFTNRREWSAGGFRAVVGQVTLSGVTSGAVNIGLVNILGGSITPVSYDSTLRPHTYMNRSSAGAALNGYVQVVSGTIGDVYEVFAVGN